MDIKLNDKLHQRDNLEGAESQWRCIHTAIEDGEKIVDNDKVFKSVDYGINYMYRRMISDFNYYDVPVEDRRKCIHEFAKSLEKDPLVPKYSFEVDNQYEHAIVKCTLERERVRTYQIGEKDLTPEHKKIRKALEVDFNSYYDKARNGGEDLSL